MDFLSHVFFPLTAAYLLRRELFARPWLLGLAGFGILSDFDKFLSAPGLFHSLVSIAPICLGVVVVEYWWRGDLVYSPVIAAFISSHLLLDFLDGGPVPLLFPFINTGVGVEYPIRTVFGQGLFGIRFEGPLVALRTTAPQQGTNTYGFIQGGGVASMLLFGIFYGRDQWRNWRTDRNQSPRKASTNIDQSEKQTDDDHRSDH